MYKLIVDQYAVRLPYYSKLVIRIRTASCEPQIGLIMATYDTIGELNVENATIVANL